MTERLRNWFIHLLLDLLCWAVPQNERYELIIEREGDDMVAVLRELRNRDG